MGTVYSPDCDILVLLVRSGRADAMMPLRPPVVVTDTVWRECGTWKKGDRAGDAGARLALVESWAKNSTAIQPATAESQTAATLLSQGDLDPGEVSILALAYHRADIVPVFHDRQALFRSVEEMHLRPVLSYHGFLKVLRDSGLSVATANSISQHYCDHLTWTNQSTPRSPIWW